MADAVEHTMEAPYLVTDTNRRGWGAACSCGFRSPLFDSREEAQAAASAHLESPPVAEPKGFLAKRRARKQQRPDWMERRKG